MEKNDFLESKPLLYSLSTYHSSKLGYLIYSWDYYDKTESKCETCGRSKIDLSLKYWPPIFSLEGEKNIRIC